MTLRLNGSTSGYTEIDAPAVAGSNTLVLPTGNGLADQALVTNGSGTLSFADRGRMTLATAQNSTSGTSIDFTGIPSWVKRVTVMFSGVSTNGSSLVIAQLGAGSVISTGYNGFYFLNSTNRGSLSSGFVMSGLSGATAVLYGTAVFTLLGSNAWVGNSVTTEPNVVVGSTQCAGSITLASSLDRLRITTVNGTDTFDAGSINLLLEG
jgi:hypothetical protein